ncbi:glycosyltransferase family 39 protein [Candidatus Roizmanbacteria bacterium]|nr:glycosyltransferase family 39 protein [Candidatus Roizmanbacteria bacterium]
MKKNTILILVLILALSLFLNVYKKDVSPPAFDADEAAFGYNAYSIAKTGKDEYGAFLPLRLKSFGDYKMPLYSYLSAALVGVFGLNEASTRALNAFLALLFPLAVFLLAKELFQNDAISLLSAFLAAFSLGLHIVGRQAHEAYLSAFLTILATLFFVKILKKLTVKNAALFLLFLFLSLFSYQSARVFALYFFVFGLISLFRVKKAKLFLLSFSFVRVLFFATDLLYQPKRIGTLLFFNNPGFTLKINELRYEGGTRLLYNKLSVGAKETLSSYAKYFSPQFLTISGDENPRFGFTDMAPITFLEYGFLFVGLYYLIKKKERFRILLLSLLLVAPLSSSLSWAGLSLTRSLFLLIPILLIASYGGVALFAYVPKRYKVLTATSLIAAQLLLLLFSWDFYLNHYPKRAVVVRAWQSGYRELSQYVKENYDKFNTFSITKKHGQPYIFLLFYLNFPPENYQRQATLSQPDEYGFGQVEKFDKFVFQFVPPQNVGRSVVIGFPEEFRSMPEFQNIDQSKFRKIVKGSEEIFWILEPPR